MGCLYGYAQILPGSKDEVSPSSLDDDSGSLWSARCGMG